MQYLKFYRVVLVLCVLIPSLVNAQIYPLGNTASNTGWFKLGTLTLSQGGYDAQLRILGGGGYNADVNQNGEALIRFRTSNGGSNNNGFYGSGSYYNTGRSRLVGAVTIVQQADISKWDIYAVLPYFTGDAAIIILESFNGTWVRDFRQMAAPVGTSSALTEEYVVSSPLSVQNYGNSYQPWNRFTVTNTSLWGDGLSSPAETGGVPYVTIGAGGAAGIMLSAPYVAWRQELLSAGIRYGRSGGVSTGTWWEGGVNASGGFHIRKESAPGTGIEILNNGFVGIGTPNPIRRLHVAGPGTSTEFIMESTDGLADWKKLNFFVAGGVGSPQNLYLRILNDAGTATTRDLMSWINNGNIGIGTISPQSPLTVGNLNSGAGEATYKGTIQIQSNGGDINTAGGLEFKGSPASAGFGWRVAAPDYLNLNVPLVFQYRTNSASWTEALRIKNDGSVGIGTNNPVDAVQVGNYMSVGTKKIVIPGTYNFEQVRIGQYGNGVSGMEMVNHVDYNNSYGIKIVANSDEIPGLQIKYTPSTASSYAAFNYSTGIFMGLNGNVGIGTTSTGNMRLAVNGTIGARKVVVTQVSPFPDYVFKSDYKLRPLNEVETYINTFSHLPEIPSAEEVEKDGLDLAQTQTALLKKIEELTLYVIEQSKENKELKKRVEQLEHDKK